MPFKYELKSVALSDIDSEIDTFRITTKNRIDDLIPAMDRVGLTNPPILEQTPEGYVVVCGFRRIAAARSLGWLSIPARLVPEDASPLFCALLAISENSVERPLNPIETSRALFLLSSLIDDEEELLKTAKKVGLPVNQSQIKRLLPLCSLPKSLQEGILAGNLALPSVQMLSDFPDETAVLIADFLIKLNLSLHKQRELIGIVDEIIKIEGGSIESILGSSDIRQILDDPETDMPRKAGKIREYFKKRRFPHISRAQAEFERFKSRLKLGENVSLKPPAGFESNRYTVSLSFGSMPEFEKQIKTLEKLSVDEEFARLLCSRDPDCD